MGQQQSSVNYQQIVYESFSEKISEIINKNIQNTTGSVDIFQNMKITFGTEAELKNCNIAISQNVEVTQKLHSFLQTTQEAQIKNMLDQAIQNSLDTKQNQNSPAFTLVPYSQQSAENYQIMSQKLISITKNIIQNTNFSECIAKLDSLQNLVFEFNGKLDCSPSGLIEITQNLIVENIVNCSTSSIVKNLFENKEMTDIVNKAESDQKQTITLSGLIKLLIVILAIIIIGFVIYKIVKKV